MNPRSALLVLILAIACDDAPAPEGVVLDSTPPPTAAPSPLFQSALWPGEGIPVLESTGLTIIFREAPDPEAPARDSVTPPADTRLAFDSTAVITRSGGTLTALRSVILTARHLGTSRTLTRERYYEDAPSMDVPVDSGATITLLQYRAEGGCFLLVGDDVHEAETCPTLLDPPAFRVDEEPVTDWWVFAMLGDAWGWTVVDGKVIVVADREF